MLEIEMALMGVDALKIASFGRCPLLSFLRSFQIEADVFKSGYCGDGKIDDAAGEVSLSPYRIPVLLFESSELASFTEGYMCICFGSLAPQLLSFPCNSKNLILIIWLEMR
jgi:hypothetical protein